jgi:hypothetical protein
MTVTDASVAADVSSSNDVLPMPLSRAPGAASSALPALDTEPQQRMMAASRDNLAGMGTGGRGGTVSPSGTVIIELIVNGEIVETTEV